MQDALRAARVSPLGGKRGNTCYGAGWENDHTGAYAHLRFSFAILTDFHIGVGIDDFGFPNLIDRMTPTHNPEHDITSSLVNFRFTSMGYDFVSLDLVTRAHAPPEYPGIGPEADLHDFEGGSWPWFTRHVADSPCRGDHNILVFLHHPPMASSLFGMNETDLAKLNEFIVGRGYGSSPFGFFAGHYHIDLEYEEFDGQKIIVTPANKDGITARLVQIRDDGSLDYDTYL